MTKSAVRETTKKPSYGKKVELTDKIVIRAASKAIRNASSKAMKTIGYVVKAEGGWLVRKDTNGHIQKIKKLKTESSEIVLD